MEKSKAFPFASSAELSAPFTDTTKRRHTSTDYNVYKLGTKNKKKPVTTFWADLDSFEPKCLSHESK